ncbi:MAG: prepilin-type N-terminal cleavage/methylation domain-containing protein [Gammaproteobacteria bacterium]|nr:prepilin-type N-terminal cleavage/methylation domain-containing protein [Gammaproteobacteria bacterium]
MPGLRKNKGFSLLEVLITLIVLGMGLISLAMFQGAVTKDSSLAKERSIAVYLAQQKIEDLRNYAALEPPSPNPLSLVDYTAIGNNQGGLVARTVTGTVAVLNSNVQYTRSWGVRNLYYPLTHNSLPTTTAPSTPPGFPSPIPDLKEVVVSVTWPDRDGITPPDCTLPLTSSTYDTRVCLTTFISASDPSR